MHKTDARYKNFVQILREELVPAMGCTEPIAIAYGAAKAREVLGCLPETVLVEASTLPKCGRCWTHSASVGENSEHPELCERCAAAI